MSEITLSAGTIVLFVLCALYISCLYWLAQTGYKKELSEQHLAAKISCSTGFMIVLTAGAFISGRFFTEFSLFVMLFIASLFCLGGDVFIALANGRSKLFSRYFLTGVGSFMAGHLVFCVVFYAMVPFSIFDLLLPAVSLTLVFCCGQSTRFRLKRMHMMVPGLVYSVMVALMAEKGVQVGLAWGLGTARGLLTALGCMMFFVSDGLILLVYFAVKKRNWARGLNLVLYYIGMLCIALSMAL